MAQRHVALRDAELGQNGGVLLERRLRRNAALCIIEVAEEEAQIIRIGLGNGGCRIHEKAEHLLELIHRAQCQCLQAFWHEVAMGARMLRYRGVRHVLSVGQIVEHGVDE